MAETSTKPQEVERAQKRALRRKQVLDMLEPRIMTLLIFTPPTLGIILGGVAVSAYRRMSGIDILRLPNDYVTFGLCIFCVLGLSVVGYFSTRVYRGGQTRFPRLLRVAPFTAIAGLAFGVVIASLKAMGKIS